MSAQSTKSTKSNKKNSTVVPVETTQPTEQVAPVSPVSPASPSKGGKKTKASKQEVSSPVSVPVSSPEPSPVPSPSPSSPVPTQESSPTPESSHQMSTNELREHTASRNKQFLDDLTELRNRVNVMINEFRRVVKDNERLLNMTANSKRVKKVKVVSPSGSTRKNGFQKPTLLSDQLCAFLDKPKGHEMARVEVTKELNKYIKSHNLQNPVDKRNIVPDHKLEKLLGLKKGDTLTYFNLQTHLAPLFDKKPETKQVATA